MYTIHPYRYGQFRGGDSYVVQYTYKKNKIDNYIIYFWLGNESSADEKGTAALKTKVLIFMFIMYIYCVEYMSALLQTMSTSIYKHRLCEDG